MHILFYCFLLMLPLNTKDNHRVLLLRRMTTYSYIFISLLRLFASSLLLTCISKIKIIVGNGRTHSSCFWICNSDDLFVEGISLENSQQYVETARIRCTQKQWAKRRVVLTLLLLYLCLNSVFGNQFVKHVCFFIMHTHFFCWVIIFLKQNHRI
jgi:hypothetical protein